MLRAINGTKIKDRVTVKSMLKKFGLLSVNQLSAQIKLVEVWKARNVEGYALSFDPYQQQNIDTESQHNLRPKNNRVLNDTARLKISKQSFNVDAARLWNQAPIEITSAATLASAKLAILKFAKSLPI